MNPKRLKHLKQVKKNGKYVIYWMQQAQRVHANHALNYAVKVANDHHLPLIVYVSLYGDYPDANERSFTFMLEGLQDVKKWLERLGINFVLRIGQGHVMIFDYLNDAHMLVLDKGYLKHQSMWRDYVIKHAQLHQLSLGICMIDTDLIVPVEVASKKREYAAYTIRKKLHQHLSDFRDIDHLTILNNQDSLHLESDDDLCDIEQLVKKLKVSNEVKKSPYFKGGYIEASTLFSRFIANQLNAYKDRNDPSNPIVSHMSMYLHFGQISSLELLERVFLALEQHQIDQESADAFIEQLFVRRELAYNYVYYEKKYDEFEHMTQNWAYTTMKNHLQDQRTYIYSLEDYENFHTHDEAFNAAMIEMVKTGYMHNYMRMYWAKKIMEWSKTYEEAYRNIIYLNNKYFIDGRDANSYAGVAWCFGNHDRPWTERPIFGQLRYMNESGLKRKFNIKAYIDLMYRLLDD